MNYYERLKDLREDAEKTQKEIAELLNMTQSVYSKYELGKTMMGIDKYIKLATYYNISLDYLAGLTLIPRKLYMTEVLTPQQMELLEKYEKNSEYKIAVNKLLDIKGE